MGQGFRSPSKPGANRAHNITLHAIERLREYASDIGRSAQDAFLGDLMDEVLVEALEEGKGEHIIDAEGTESLLIAFDRDRWADPGLSLLVHGLDNPRKKVVTVLTATAVENMDSRKRIVKYGSLLPEATAQALKEEAMKEREQEAQQKEEAIDVTKEVPTPKSPREEKPAPVDSLVKAMELDLKAMELGLDTALDEVKALTSENERLKQQLHEAKKISNQVAQANETQRLILTGKLEQMEVVMGLLLDRMLDRLE